MRARLVPQVGAGRAERHRPLAGGPPCCRPCVCGWRRAHPWARPSPAATGGAAIAAPLPAARAQPHMQPGLRSCCSPGGPCWPAPRRRLLITGAASGAGGTAQASSMLDYVGGLPTLEVTSACPSTRPSALLLADLVAKAVNARLRTPMLALTLLAPTSPDRFALGAHGRGGASPASPSADAAGCFSPAAGVPATPTCVERAPSPCRACPVALPAGASSTDSSTAPRLPSACGSLPSSAVCALCCHRCLCWLPT